jgi:hypothetical protein
LSPKLGCGIGLAEMGEGVNSGRSEVKEYTPDEYPDVNEDLLLFALVLLLD